MEMASVRMELLPFMMLALLMPIAEALSEPWTGNIVKIVF